jgi:hypothetical protein
MHQDRVLIASPIHLSVPRPCYSFNTIIKGQLDKPSDLYPVLVDNSYLLMSLWIGYQFVILGINIQSVLQPLIDTLQVLMWRHCHILLYVEQIYLINS